MVSGETIRRYVLAGGIAAITAIGTWYGADLKISEESQAEKQKRREATPEQVIALLEKRRTALMVQRAAIERKLEEIEMRNNGATRAESRAGMERKR